MTDALGSAPLATADLPGTGGRIGPVPEDFRVEEIPAYAPAGQGTHSLVRVRKRALTSPEAARRLARALGVPPGEVGIAGMKDRWAITEQWMSFPAPPEAFCGLAVDGVEVLEAAAHPHKLRTGHLRGNRFRVRLVDVAEDAPARAEAVVLRLAERGVPNLFGPQRFGRDRDNAARGLTLLAGGAGPRDRRERRLLVSAAQSALFNAYLAARLGWPEPRRPRPGEVLCRLPAGGQFLCGDPETDARRVASGEIAPTGPLFGPKMRAPAPRSEAARLEEAVLAAAEIPRALFEGWRKLAPGGRRPLWIPAEELRVAPDAAPGALLVTVTLPAGAYATVLLHELTHTPIEALRGVEAGEPGAEPEAALPEPES